MFIELYKFSKLVMQPNSCSMDFGCDKSGSGFKKNNSKNPNKDKKNRACFHCGKKCHYIREYKRLKNKKKDKGNANEINVIKDIIAMVSSIHIDMITEVYIAVIANPFDW